MLAEVTGVSPERLAAVLDSWIPPTHSAGRAERQ